MMMPSMIPLPPMQCPPPGLMGMRPPMHMGNIPPPQSTGPACPSANICTDTSDSVELYAAAALYLKPVAKVSITVQIPQMRATGKSFTTKEVIDKIQILCNPEELFNVKVVKSSLDFLRLEAEIQSKTNLDGLIKNLDQQSLIIDGFTEPLKLRTCEAKISFPTRPDWDSYFRDAKGMNQLKPGERPDTIYVSGLPNRWFSGSRDVDKPSDFILRKAFEGFGDIRCVDIPSLDNLRSQMSETVSGIHTFNFELTGTFEAYVQYKEYVGFVKAMTSLRGMKVMYRDPYSDLSWTANIKVDFDKSKHLSDVSIRKRRLEKERLLQLKKEEYAKEKRIAQLQEMKDEQEKRKILEVDLEIEKLKEERRKLREEKRKQKQVEALKQN